MNGALEHCLDALDDLLCIRIVYQLVAVLVRVLVLL